VEGVIILFGGNSVIGNLVIEGLQVRTGKTEVYRVSRGSPSEETEDVVTGFFASPLSDGAIRMASHLVLSVGIPERQLLGIRASERLREILEINVMKTLEFLELLEDRRRALGVESNLLEIHLVSSILADFVKPGVVDYSLSKTILDTKVRQIYSPTGSSVKLFVWRFSFVSSPFHLPGEGRALSANPGQIRKRVSRAQQPGVRYVPRTGRFVGSALRLSPTLFGLISK
jgi:hypothetical protein